MRITLHLLFP